MFNESALKFSYKVIDLIDIMKKNRETHVEAYRQALVRYKQQLVCVLEAKLKAAKNGELVNHVITLPKPVEYISQYDQAIKMLEMTCSASVELDEIKFKKLVLDEWEWSGDFVSNTVSYTNKLRKSDDQGI